MEVPGSGRRGRAGPGPHRPARGLRARQRYSQYAIADAGMCLPLGDVSSEDGASAFVNPMTALGFVKRRPWKTKGIIHGSLEPRANAREICQEDGRPLVNIVRSDAQVELLKGLGAGYIVNSSAPDFMDQLRAADATDAFCGFDPIGGGMNTDACFKAMEQVAVSEMSEFSHYDSNQQKKMYIYGPGPGTTTLTPSYGFDFTLSGWLLTPFLQVGLETMMRMRQRVLDNITTTFAAITSAR